MSTVAELQTTADYREITKEDALPSSCPRAGKSLELTLEMNIFLWQHQKLVLLLVAINPRIQKASEYLII